jgi:hypothetical protein
MTRNDPSPKHPTWAATPPIWDKRHARARQTAITAARHRPRQRRDGEELQAPRRRGIFAASVMFAFVMDQVKVSLFARLKMV